MNLETLFETSEPLASRLRPRMFADIVGQEKVLVKGSPLHRLLSGVNKGAQSIILWGPPGSGKTSITNVLANLPGRSLVQLSAISAGVKEVREVIDKARTDSLGFGVETILFLDEIHRFSKAQQDSLLPAVEAGIVILVAATTENPSFSIIDPLISRSLVVQLETLSNSALEELVDRALSSDRGFRSFVSISPDAKSQLVANAQGDARRALTFLEALAFAAYQRGSKRGKVEISTEDFATALTATPTRYDRDGDSHYDIISAFIKSVRGSDVDAAIYWLARMLEGGEDPRFIARRLMILAAEDVGLADPQALVLATSAAQSVALIGMPEARIALSEVTIYLALAPKSNSAYLAINKALEDVREGLIAEVPKPLRSSNNSAAEILGNGVGYDYPHDYNPPVVKQEYLGGTASLRDYYVPKITGAEEAKVTLWSSLRKIIRGK